MIYRLFLLGIASLISFTAAAQSSFTIADYPRYATAVAALPLEDQAALRTFSIGLVGAVIAGQSVDVMVIGHADFDAKGREFELGVSRERAAGAESAAEAVFNQEADARRIPQDRRKLVRFSAIGIGTQRPVNPNPVDEEQRKANRRVEIVFTSTPVPVPDPRATYQSCLRVLKAAAPGPARRMTCVCNKLLQQPPPVVKDYFYDFQAARQLRAGAGAMSQFTPQQMKAFYGGFMLFMSKQIAQLSTASDPDLATGLIQIDDLVGRNLSDFLTQADQGAGPFERTVSIDILKRMQEPNHTYSCFAGYSRRDPNQ